MSTSPKLNIAFMLGVALPTSCGAEICITFRSQGFEHVSPYKHLHSILNIFNIGRRRMLVGFNINPYASLFVHEYPPHEITEAEVYMVTRTPPPVNRNVRSWEQTPKQQRKSACNVSRSQEATLNLSLIVTSDMLWYPRHKVATGII
ncbi:hypothetical protein BJ875DRAFT_509431 [Amylocarpus encephaloides]|uniref:Uncharacterized protein n=1 Tax=Amylocarpus encephaloides TaxID=45428 RepID=A0A9P7YJB4_9HELO|nr:hypothetical protein BJ875DRAFT_509431 [Amylocarpus encephaloides]